MDATKNAINNKQAKEHQVPEKSEEQKKYEAWLELPPSRHEMVEYVESVHNYVSNSFNTITAIIQEALIKKGVLTTKDLLNAESTIKAEIEKNRQEAAEKAKEAEEPKTEENEVEKVEAEIVTEKETEKETEE